jgi:fructose-1,6-bisphosphatase/inositol monophosphatase family enzyme
MKLNIDELQVLTKIAINAAIKAGSFIRGYTKKEIDVQYKDTGFNLSSQVVTEVDLKSQDIILKYLLPTCESYQLGLLTEECVDDGSRFEKDYFWCIDPLDGTLPFIESIDGYSVSIALVACDGTSYIGVIYDPVTQTLYHAVKGVGAFRNSKSWIMVSENNESFEIVDSGGAVINACWVLEKEPACFYKEPKVEKGGGCLWDYAATACLFEEIGAWVSDIYGNPLDLNNKDSVFMNRNGVLYATSRKIAKQFIK